jgi:hypothetical protein
VEKIILYGRLLHTLHSLKYEFAFINAGQRFESTFKDLKNIYKFIQSGGLVFLHDKYPC